MSGQLTTYVGEFWIGPVGSGIRIPMTRGATLTAPENFTDLYPVVSNFFTEVLTGGLQFPVISLPVEVTTEWFQAATLNTWFNLPRVSSTAPAYDVAALVDCFYWNGDSATNSVLKISLGKVNLVSLGDSSGQPVEARIEIWGATLTPFANTSLPTTTPFLSLPARSQNCAHTLPRNHTRWDLTLSNNLTVNDEMPSETDRSSAPYSGGTYDYASEFERPIEFNSANFSASGSFTFQAHHTGRPGQGSGNIILDGSPFDMDIWPPKIVAGAFSKTSSGTKITVVNPKWQGRYGQNFAGSRQKRSLQMTARGKADGTDAIVIAAWTPT